MALDQPVADARRALARDAHRAGLQREHVCRPRRDRLRHGDRRGEAAVEVAAPVDLDRRAARPRHPAGGQHRVPQLADRRHPRQVDRRSALDAGRDAVQRDRAGEHALVATDVQPLRGIAEDRVHVDHRPADEHARRVHERARRERPAVGRRAVARDPGDQRRAVDRAGGRADHQIEARRQPVPLQRGRHPCRHDPAHPTALEHQRDPVLVAPNARLRAGPEPLEQHLRDGMRGGVHLRPDGRRPTRGGISSDAPSEREREVGSV